MVNLKVTLLAVGTSSMSLGRNVGAKEKEEEKEEDKPRPFDAGLPSNTADAIGLTAKAIKAVIPRERDKGRGASTVHLFYLRFTRCCRKFSPHHRQQKLTHILRREPQTLDRQVW